MHLYIYVYIYCIYIYIIIIIYIWFARSLSLRTRRLFFRPGPTRAQARYPRGGWQKYRRGGRGEAYRRGGGIGPVAKGEFGVQSGGSWPATPGTKTT